MIDLAAGRRAALRWTRERVTSRPAERCRINIRSGVGQRPGRRDTINSANNMRPFSLSVQPRDPIVSSICAKTVWSNAAAGLELRRRSISVCFCEEKYSDVSTRQLLQSESLEYDSLLYVLDPQPHSFLRAKWTSDSPRQYEICPRCLADRDACWLHDSLIGYASISR